MEAPALIDHLINTIAALQYLRSDIAGQTKIQNTVNHILTTRLSGGVVFLAGNGGSLANAMHFATDLEKVCRVRTRVLGLNSSSLTAWSNDVSYDKALAEEVGLHKKLNDILIVLSCSGASPNIWGAIRVAKSRGCPIVLLTSVLAPSMANDEVNDVVRVQSDSYLVIEDCHAVICHMIVKRIGAA